MAVNIRAKRQPIGIPITTLIARPLLVVAGITRNSLGVVLPQAKVKAFRSDTDTFYSREISDNLGRYSVPVPDLSRYYTVAHQPGTVDATIPTVDVDGATVDRTRGVEGATDNTLVGAS